MRINPYLIFNGDCREAFTFYEQALQGKLEAMMTFGETPAAEHVPKEHHNLVIHTCLKVGDQMIMASDTTPDRPTQGMSGCSISLNVDSIAEAERVFNALAKDGRVDMLGLTRAQLRVELVLSAQAVQALMGVVG